MAAKPRLLVTRRLPDDVEARIRRDYDARLNADDSLIGPDTLVALAEGRDAILACPTDRFDKALIDRLPAGVRIVATFSVGYEHIDTAAAGARGIAVTNTPDVLTDSTADIALLLLLGAARRAYEGQTMLRTGNWLGWTPTQLMATHVTGKTLGIVGMGRIGQAVARRARSFEMTVHYSNRRRLPPEQEQGAQFHADVEAMLPLCQFLSLHCPLTKETRHFLDAGRIALLPAGAVVVNTSRGPVVDDEALIAALKTGKVGAAGLDVFEGEPNVDRRYFDLANTFLLPHMGSATVETRNGMGFRALDNLDDFFAGRRPRDRVN